jgi:hypothetical protein
VFVVDALGVDTPTETPPVTAPFDVEPDSWLRRPQVTTWFARYFRGLAVVCVLLAFCCAIQPTAANARDTEAVGVVAAAFFLIGAAGCEALARRYASRGLVLSANGIVVRNLLSTQRITLDDAERFSPGVPGGMNGPCPMLRCRTRRTVGVGGLGLAAFAWRYDLTLCELEPVCDRLSGLLDRLKQAARPQQPKRSRT